jgi:precorrin-3B C17-methyltransferase
MTGAVHVIGLGPGDAALTTFAATAALDEVAHVFGYFPYAARVAARPGLTIHASDNGDEMARARAAFALAADGAQVAIVSSGDPGVFAMAAATCEAMETGPAAWRGVDLQIHPGITAMLAAAARAGAPLGHDFCAINLSDNLKPWALIEKRLRLAIEGDFAMGLYNPRSRARPAGFERMLEILRETCEPGRVIVFARAVSTPQEDIRVVALQDAAPEMADMRTMVLIGSSLTRVVTRPGLAPVVYTPRSTPGPDA